MKNYHVKRVDHDGERLVEVYCTYEDGETELVEECGFLTMGEALSEIVTREGDSEYGLTVSAEYGSATSKAPEGTNGFLEIRDGEDVLAVTVPVLIGEDFGITFLDEIPHNRADEIAARIENIELSGMIGEERYAIVFA